MRNEKTETEDRVHSHFTILEIKKTVSDRDTECISAETLYV